jgi:hypothetical protein
MEHLATEHLAMLEMVDDPADTTTWLEQVATSSNRLRARDGPHR